MRRPMLKIGLASQGSIGLVLTRAWKCQPAPTFLLMIGVLVDQFAMHLGHWEGLMELQWQGMVAKYKKYTKCA